MPSYFVILVLTFIAIHGIQRNSASGANQRRILRPKDNVGEMIKNNKDEEERENEGIYGTKDRYTIHTEIEAGSNIAGTELAVDVVEAVNPAVNLDTVIRDAKGNEYPLRESDFSLFTLLVTDIETADGADTLAMLAINPKNDDMHGIVEKRGRRGERVLYKIKQSKGDNNGMAMAHEEVNLSSSDWYCDVVDEIPNEEEDVVRRLIENVNEQPRHTHEKKHEYQDHDEDQSAMESLIKSARAIKANPLNKSRRLQSANYHYQVDLFIEIDNGFISNLGGLNNAINYVNTLVTGANVVYEKEIDTHLRVTNIAMSSFYDGATSAANALSIMRANYANSNTWHTPNVDLHHAFLTSIGGGIAYIGVVCHSNWGFGLTGGMTGSFVSMGQPTVWDMKGFMHEIGHNFGSGHTHDTSYYAPVIDSCGISCPTSIGFGWSTIMSYCQWCPGSYNNIMYSFGADYDGSGDVNDLSNWSPNPNMVANYDSSHFSVNPEREAQKMYLHVNSKAPSGCVALSTPAPGTTPNPTHSPTSSYGVSFYDNSLGAPKCSKVDSFCDSGSLLNSRGGLKGVAEPNAPNTIDSCTDGSTGSYHTDESIDNVRISVIGGGTIQPGATMKIEARVWVYNSAYNFVDFFYATDATNPQWQFIETVKPVSSSSNDVSAQYTLGNGSLQAVRVVIRYNGSAKPCPGGSYDDVDDLIFVVANPTPKPTAKPTVKPTVPPTRLPTRLPTPLPTRLPSSQPTAAPSLGPTPLPKTFTSSPSAKPVTTPNPNNNQAENAKFDFELGVPKCSTGGSLCDSGLLLNSRGTISGNPEPNGPNTLDSCVDGSSGTYHLDESVDNIRVSTVNGGEFQIGSAVQVVATVWAYSPAADYADFYYATDVINPQWKFLDTLKPTTTGVNIISLQFTLGQGSADLQAVRVAFRVNGIASPCPGGSYDDVDDIAFVVKPIQPTPTQVPTPPPTQRPVLAKATKLVKTSSTRPT